MNIARALITASFTMLFAGIAVAHDWQMQSIQIRTRWAASVGASNSLPEYPRPQLVRSHWRNLNGRWQYAVTPKNSAVPSKYDGSILVPYPLESVLSGVQRPLRPDQLLWYRRIITVE